MSSSKSKISNILLCILGVGFIIWGISYLIGVITYHNTYLLNYFTIVSYLCAGASSFFIALRPRRSLPPLIIFFSANFIILVSYFCSIVTNSLYITGKGTNYIHINNDIALATIVFVLEIFFIIIACALAYDCYRSKPVDLTPPY